MLGASTTALRGSFKEPRKVQLWRRIVPAASIWSLIQLGVFPLSEMLFSSQGASIVLLHGETLLNQNCVPSYSTYKRLYIILFLVKHQQTTMEHLTSLGMGFTHLGPDNRLFLAEMFHELHCMRMLNLAFARSRVASEAHNHHCLNYLRQQALCSADLTLEPGDFMERDFVLSRTGSMHVCHDWSAVYSIMADTWSI
ncbi:hypothetical protein EDD85DRAFT_943265 [Armillaria nabsnona]|nr:hypothetical protein EDD85DRAFT_943265 [Armillaria nabsnona]